MQNVSNGIASLTATEKQKFFEAFNGLSQTELPTRKELISKKKGGREVQVKGNSTGIIAPIKRKPSASYLGNLNPRIQKAYKLWANCNAASRGELVRAMGIVNSEEIILLCDSISCPDEVIEYFIIHKNQPKNFHNGTFKVIMPSQKALPDFYWQLAFKKMKEMTLVTQVSNTTVGGNTRSSDGPGTDHTNNSVMTTAIVLYKGGMSLV